MKIYVIMCAGVPELAYPNKGDAHRCAAEWYNSRTDVEVRSFTDNHLTQQRHGERVLARQKQNEPSDRSGYPSGMDPVDLHG